MLREEVEQYTKLTGEDGWHVPIMKVGAYLDGYNKGLEMLDKIRAEIKALSPEPTAYDVVDGNPIKDAVWETLADVLRIVDKYRAENREG